MSAPLIKFDYSLQFSTKEIALAQNSVQIPIVRLILYIGKTRCMCTKKVIYVSHSNVYIYVPLKIKDKKKPVSKPFSFSSYIISYFVLI